MTAPPASSAARRIAVGIAIADARLAQRLSALIAGDARLVVAHHPAHRADVVVSDRAHAAGGPSIVIDADAHGGAEGDVRAVLPPTVDAELLRAAITVVAAGFSITEADEPQGLADETMRLDPPHAALDAPLTVRERQVLALLAHGASNKAIARELAISVHTAKFHVASVLVKLGARNRSDAVAIGIRRGLVMM